MLEASVVWDLIWFWSTLLLLLLLRLLLSCLLLVPRSCSAVASFRLARPHPRPSEWCRNPCLPPLRLMRCRILCVWVFVLLAVCVLEAKRVVLLLTMRSVSFERLCLVSLLAQAMVAVNLA